MAYRIMIACILILLASPVITTFLTAFAGFSVADRHNRRLAVFSIGLSGLAGDAALVILINRLLDHHWNILNTFRQWIAFHFTYQDIDQYATFLLLLNAAAFFWGLILHVFFNYLFSRPVAWNGLRKRTRAALIGEFSLIGLFAIGVYYIGFSGANRIAINEVADHNITINLDEAGKAHDYIELYNRGRFGNFVGRLYLSDDPDDLQKMEVPAAVVSAHGYFLVSLGDELSLDKDGEETVILSDQNGAILDRVTTAPTSRDYAWSRLPDGTGGWGERKDTPGYSNQEGMRKVAAPSFSQPSGFYENSFDLTVTSEAGTTIHYTTDGTVPTADSDVYTDPVRIYDKSSELNHYRGVYTHIVNDWQNKRQDDTPVDKAFIIRAVAVSEDGSVSAVSTASYFIDKDKYKDNVVVSLVSDPDRLFGDNGIYVTGTAYDEWYTNGQQGNAPTPNYLCHGAGFEIPTFMSFFSDDGSFEQEAGLRIGGGSTRRRALKNFKVYARKAYSGGSVFNKKIFGGIYSHSLYIRGGYANALVQRLAADRNAAVERMRRAYVFINGEFWYQTYLVEQYDDRYFQEHYGVGKDNAVVFERGQAKTGDPEDQTLLAKLNSFISSHDFSDPAVYTEFCGMVDMQSYIDYMAVNEYIDNMDFSETTNNTMWRSRTEAASPYEDCRWRWAFNDLDAMEWNDAGRWDVPSQAQKNTFKLKARYGGVPACEQPMFAALLHSDEFRKQFELTFMDLVNTMFQYDNVKKHMDAIGYNFDSFQSGNGGTADIPYYQDFFKTRARFIVPYMADALSLKGSLQEVRLVNDNPEGGSVSINTIEPSFTNGRWTGRYYTDFPVEVTASPKEGYTFAGWTGGLISDEETITTEIRKGGLELHAHFEKTK